MSKKYIEKVSVKVKAIEKGQHGGRLINPGESFSYNGNIVNGNFPKWVKRPKGFESKFSKLSKSEQASYLREPTTPGKELNESQLRAKIEDEMREQIEAEVRAKIEDELSEQELGEDGLDQNLDGQGHEEDQGQGESSDQSSIL